jgi:hypothetical protein
MFRHSRRHIGNVLLSMFILYREYIGKRTLPGVSTTISRSPTWMTGSLHFHIDRAGYCAIRVEKLLATEYCELGLLFQSLVFASSKCYTAVDLVLVYGAHPQHDTNIYTYMWHISSSKLTSGLGLRLKLKKTNILSLCSSSLARWCWHIR